MNPIRDDTDKALQYKHIFVVLTELINVLDSCLRRNDRKKWANGWNLENGIYQCFSEYASDNKRYRRQITGIGFTRDYCTRMLSESLVFMMPFLFSFMLRLFMLNFGLIYDNHISGDAIYIVNLLILNAANPHRSLTVPGFRMFLRYYHCATADKREHDDKK
ncbi:MAG: hypothetical protein RBS43_06660 [Candidatus Cloacimonas sp.]|jgi:hypothetical protein|nr:hypothetical protein [Candidatus Cloacimonas sp.]